jgi:hypothetical protein
MAGGGSSEMRDLVGIVDRLVERVCVLERQVADLQGIVHGRDVPCSPPSGSVGAALPKAQGAVGTKPPGAGRITMKRVR